MIGGGNMYGKELILDVHDCDISIFTRASLEYYFQYLCDDLIDMKRAALHFWDYEGISYEEYERLPSHLKGISAIQFIQTSNITIHTLDDLGVVYLNIFSCKDFNPEVVKDFTEKFFKGQIKNSTLIERD